MKYYHQFVLELEFMNKKLKFALVGCGRISKHHSELLDLAKKIKSRYIINGMNFATECMAVPAGSYGHSDLL